ncbi:MAG: DUF4214 domain-containing protein [Bdellovibrionia bacterium]
MKRFSNNVLRTLNLCLITAVAVGCTSTKSARFTSSSISVGSVQADQSAASAAGNSGTSGNSGTVTAASSPSGAGLFTCNELAAYGGTGRNAADVILACIHQTPAGGILELPAGLYTIANQITFDRSITLRTQGRTDSKICDYELGLDCAVLIADPNLNVQFGLMNNTQPNVTIDHIVLDGNREARIGTSTGAAIAQNCSKDNTPGYNAVSSGAGFSFINSVSKHAICGTGMGPSGDRLTVQNSAFVENGDHRGVWSDGLTVGDASNSKFIGNIFISNSDVDFIFGGCKNCVIQNNVIKHSTHYRYGSFAAFMTHAWPNGATSGDYAGSDISGNQIDCGAARGCGFGMMLGADPWYQAKYYGGGDYHDNVVSNAQEGLIIDHTTASIRVRNNSVQNAGGGTNTGGCGFRGTESYDVSPNSIVDFSGDGVGASSYQHVDWKGCIANSSEYLHPALAAQVVSQMYQELLGRPVDSSGLSSFSTAISKGMSVSKAWVSIAKSAEAASLISATYQTILGRVASSSEIAGWQSFLSDGHNLRQMRAAFILSPEGQARFRSVLIQSLGRAPSPSELQGWGNAVMNGAKLPSASVNAAAVFNTSYSVLKTFVPGCDGSAALSATCNAAINRFCVTQGYGAGGFGPVEHAGDVAIVTCLPSAQASIIATTFTAMRKTQPLCDPMDPLSVACGSAINRFCSIQGFASGGYGPLEFSGDSTAVGCVKPLQADLVSDSFTHLKDYMPYCDATTAAQDVCKAAIHRRCRASGYVSGYGLLEIGNDLAFFACVK